MQLLTLSNRFKTFKISVLTFMAIKGQTLMFQFVYLSLLLPCPLFGPPTTFQTSWPVTALLPLPSPRDPTHHLFSEVRQICGLLPLPIVLTLNMSREAYVFKVFLPHYLRKFSCPILILCICFFMIFSVTFAHRLLRFSCSHFFIYNPCILVDSLPSL